MIRGGNGIFDVVVDGQRIFSKDAVGRFLDDSLAARRRVVEREAARQDKTRRAEVVRQEELLQRQERIDASEREKRDRRIVKERAKLWRTRTKRRAVLVSQIKRRIGFGRTEGSSTPK